MVEELLLGDNPFIGVSHLAQEKAREEAREASLENRVRVFEAAVEAGAHGFTFSTCEANLELLTHLSAQRGELLDRMNYYILVPDAQQYVRRANVGGTPALIKSTLKTMIQRRSSTLEVLAALMSLRPERFAGIFIENEVAPYLKLLPEEKVKAVFLHEVLTDLALAFNLVDLLRFLEGYVGKRLRTRFGLETRNLGILHKTLSESGWLPEYLMTPLNPLGYQMAPNRRAVEEAVEELGGEAKVMAINVMASGAVSLDEAIGYLSRFEDEVYGVTTASTKPHRIRGNLQRLSQAFL